MEMSDFQLNTKPIVGNKRLNMLNTGKKIEKYSLRQRHKRAIDPVVSKPYSKAKTQDSGHKHKSNSFLPGLDLGRNSEVYSPLSPTSSIASSFSSEESPKKPEKPKTKAAPLSKYRRKTANARERTRMREINCAFETLRKCVPITMSLNTTQNTLSSVLMNTAPQPVAVSPPNEKLTKITTLRLAMKYIKFLTQTLDEPVPVSALSHCPISPAMSPCAIDSNNNSCSSTNSSHDLSTMLNVKIPSSNNSNKILDPSKLLLSTVNCPQTKLNHFKPPSMNEVLQSSALSNHNRHDQLFGTPCLTPPIDDSSSSDLDLLFELSDAETNHLSDPYLSPPLSGQNVNISSNSSICHDEDNPLQLAHLLSSDKDSHHLSDAYLSPLGDEVEPFSDLLNTDFSEETVLDTYLLQPLIV